MPKYGDETEGQELVRQFADQVKGRIFLITGPSVGGLGAETVTSLAQGQPAALILLGRSLSRVQPVIDAAAAASPSTTIKFVQVDLSLLSSVRAAADAILADDSIPRIDVQINNAAIMACPFALTPEGFESQLAADHLGHFVLTNRLLPKLLNGTEPVRIVNVSSCGNRAGPIRWTDPNFSQPDSYEPWEAYGQAKTSNVLFTVALNKKLARKYPDRDIRSYALHPGYISTNLQKHSYLPGWAETSVQKMFKGEPSPITKQKSLQQGCATALRAALDPGLSKEEGVWLVDCELSTDPTWIEPYALDEADAERHWGWSEELVGEKFEI